MNALIKHRAKTWITWFSKVEGVESEEEALNAYRDGDCEPTDYSIEDSTEWEEATVVWLREEDN